MGVLADALAVASMGPRFCKRGNANVRAIVSRLTAELQWGHAFVSVETAGKANGGNSHPGLQWGHAFVSVETDSQRLRRWDVLASMGPRFCKRGNMGMPA